MNAEERLLDSWGHRGPREDRILLADDGTRPAYRPDVDGLRAVAVLAVIAFHVDASVLPGGFVGVDIFFVISGFLISSIIFKDLGRGEFSFAGFYNRRIRRIFPALTIVLIAVWALGWFFLLPDAFQELGRNVSGAAGFMSNVVLWRESGYFDRAAEQKPLLHLWSLGVEEQFYLLWPGLMFLSWKRGLNLLLVVATIGIASFLLNVLAVHEHPAAVFYLPLTRLWELLLGGALAYASVFGYLGGVAGARARWWSWYVTRSLRVRNAESLLGLLAIAVAFATVNPRHGFPGWWALLPTVGAVLVISAGPDAWINRRVLSRPALVLVGLISYPLYLWHWPLLSYLRILSIGAPPALWVFGAVLAAFALAWMTYRFLERPIRTVKPLKLNRAAISLAASLGFVAIVGLWADVSGGAPVRFATALQQITNFKYDILPEYRSGRCFLNREQNQDAFSADCVDPAVSPGAPLLFLWGDSHSAHLYPGLRRLQHEYDFRVAQYTISACPPLVDTVSQYRPHCPDINAFVLAEIERLKPVTVVLSASWSSYADLSRLSNTVELLKTVGIGRIVLVGPVPIWGSPLPDVLVAAFKKDPRHRVPTRTSFGLLPVAGQLDRQIRELALQLKVAYISVVDIMCDDHGCLARVGDRQDDLTAWDNTHLTAAGSAFVVRAAAPSFFDAPLQAAIARR